MAHDHHDHAHAPKDFGLAFAVAALLNIALVVAQIIYGLSAHSIALLADAGHNFGDVLGLLLAWGAHVLARRRPTQRYTYGFRSASILSALVNAVLLLTATGAIAWEAVGRLSNPGEVAGLTVMLVAGIGVGVDVEVLEQPERRVGVAVGPAGDRHHGTADARVALAGRAVPPVVASWRPARSLCGWAGPGSIRW